MVFLNYIYNFNIEYYITIIINEKIEKYNLYNDIKMSIFS